MTGNQCANPAFHNLIQRVTFNNASPDPVVRCQATTGIANIARVHVNTINGGSQMTQGFDLAAQCRNQEIATLLDARNLLLIDV